MLRKQIFRTRQRNEFRNRGKDVLRIEALSDGVFAFSVSLLVASLEVPQTFYELKLIVLGAIPFFLTVGLIFLFWYEQYIYFRRYGLNDVTTIVLNLVYLAVILFYIYPLKFLFSLLIYAWSGINLFPKAMEQGLVILSDEDFPKLIILFSFGYFLIWFIIFLMHRHVLKLSKTFNFNNFEKLFTKKEARGALWNSVIGLVAIVFAWQGREIMAGICYLLIPAVLLMNQILFKRAYKKAEKSPANTD